MPCFWMMPLLYTNVSMLTGQTLWTGNYGNIRGHFDCMKSPEHRIVSRGPFSQGLYLSSQGHFHEADQCLREAPSHARGGSPDYAAGAGP